MTHKSPIAIRAHNLTVDFPTYAADRSLKRSILKASTGGRFAADSKAKIAIRALDNLNFEIRPGDRVGVYGHNGSGKSTLLRVLTGAYAPTGGKIEINGSVASLLDISMGMEGDATGWENIYLRGLMMGLAPSKIKPKLQEIGEFSGLGEYLSMPLRTYSSGMQIRLAFAVSTSVQADILLLDEWLSVGDEDFQSKAATRLLQLIDGSSIMVLASHSKDVLRGLCNRIFYMAHGKIIEDSFGGK